MLSDESCAGSPPRALLTSALSVLFLVSGFAALVYEIVWERALRLSFGVSTYSVAVVTAAFMAGLAGGYRLGGTERLRRFHPLRAYAVAEIGIAAWALVFPWLLPLVDRVYVASGGSLAARTILAFVLLLPPAALMGVTLPVAARMFPSGISAGGAAGVLFAANTAGAVVGTLGASWVFLRLWGASVTSAIAIAANVAAAVGGLALSLRFRTPTSTGGEDAPLAAASGLPAAGILLAVAAFSAGVQTMGLQVVWNRTLVCVVENNTTSFALILAAVLIGSSLGALAYALVGRRIREDPRRLLAVFLGAEIFLAVWVAGSITLLNRLYDLAGTVQSMIPMTGVASVAFVRLVVALVPVAPAAAAGAFLLPLLVDLVRAARAEVDRGRSVGAVFSADSVGSVAGSLGAGFVLIPVLGLAGSLAGLSGLALATAAIALIGRGGGRRLIVAGGIALVAAAVAVAVLVRPLTLTRWYDGHQGVRGDLVLYREGTFGTVSVFRIGERKELLINCIEEVPDHRDALLLFKLLGHTPLLIHPAPKRVLVNALGGGITLGAVLLHDVDVEAVELVPEVREAMRLFAAENLGAADKPGWRFVHDDGRNHLRLQQQPYDVITADATHPAAGESWPLYTREYYAIVRDHLPEDGVFAQWLPLHNMAEEDFLAALRTFRSSFADVVVLFVQRYCVLVGSRSALRLDATALTRRIEADPDVRADLAAFGIRSGEDLLRYVVLDAQGVERLTGDGPLITDDHAPVEFAELHRIGVRETFHADLALLAQALDPKRLAARTGLSERVFEARRRLLGAMLRSRDPTLASAFAAARELEEARRLAPADADVAAVLVTVQESVVRAVASDYREILAGDDLPAKLDLLVYARDARPEDPFLNQVAGAALLRLERFAEALPYLERAAALRPDDVTYQSNLAFAYEQAGRPHEALAALAEVERLAPGNPAVARVRERIERGMDERRNEP